MSNESDLTEISDGLWPSREYVCEKRVPKQPVHQDDVAERIGF